MADWLAGLSADARAAIIAATIAGLFLFLQTLANLFYRAWEKRQDNLRDDRRALQVRLEDRIKSLDTVALDLGVMVNRIIRQLEEGRLLDASRDFGVQAIQLVQALDAASAAMAWLSYTSPKTIGDQAAVLMEALTALVEPYRQGPPLDERRAEELEALKSDLVRLRDALQKERRGLLGVIRRDLYHLS